WNCQGHDERQAPFPKSNQRNDDDKDDRFVQCTQEQMNVFFDLEGLVRGMGDDQVRWKNLFELGQFPVDGLAERRDLPLVAHVDRKRDHTSELQSLAYLVCRLLLEKKIHKVRK